MSGRGVLFDVDGTLVDTTYWHAVCWGEALAAHGLPVAMATVHRAIGAGTSELLDEVLGADRDRSRDDELSAAHTERWRSHWDELRTLPGARELLAACHERGLTVVLASSASGEELEMLQGVIDTPELIDAATSSADAEAAKPHPDILHAALQKVGLAPGDAVFVGDAVWDGHASRKAGLPFIGLACGGTSAAELREAGAVEVWRDPAELLDHLGESILGAR